MPQFARKVLWVVGMTTAAQESRLLNHAQACRADAVCIRTTNSRLSNAIGRFHAAGIKVYGWRWPAVRPTTAAAHYFAIDEANHVAQALIPNGLDGYIADPEADSNPAALNYWNNPALGPLARNYCAIIKTAAGANFAFGVTSGCIYPTNRPNIPWAEFVNASDALFPQSYWRANIGGHSTNINGGNPVAAVNRGLNSWQAIAGGKPIVPMAGEIDLTTAVELGQYGAHLQHLNIDQFHFYADSSSVSAARLAAIAAI